MKQTKFTTESFINEAREKHDDSYDYSHVKYVTAKTPVCIICPKHGEFWQRPEQHINRGHGCPRCGYQQRAKTRRSRSKWQPFNDARRYVRSLNLNGVRGWDAFCASGQRPNNIPASPKITYRNEWKGWKDWLGVNLRTKDFLPFEEARNIARTFNLRSWEEWVHFCNLGERPNNIPFNPKKVYEAWESWGDWLGYESRANGNLPGIVYVLQQSDLPTNVYKIGRTYRLDKRLYEHYRINHVQITVLQTFDVPNMKLAEDYAHQLALRYGRQFKYRRSKEYFQINDIQTVIALLIAQYL